MDKLVRGSYGAFEGFADTVSLVLIKLVSIPSDLALPVFDLQNEGDSLINHHKIFFQIEAFVWHHHVADHAVKAFAQHTADSFLTVTSELLDLLKRRKSGSA